jgi:hypothetical protein
MFLESNIKQEQLPLSPLLEPGFYLTALKDDGIDVVKKVRRIDSGQSSKKSVVGGGVKPQSS